MNNYWFRSQGRRSHRIIGRDIKEDWGSGDPSGVQGQKLFVKLHIIFALKYNKQLLSLESTS